MKQKTSVPRHPYLPDRQAFPNNFGFTLIEVLIYSTIFVIASGVMLGIVTVVTKFESQQNTSVELTHQLEFALQHIKRLITQSSALEIGDAGRTLRLYTHDKDRATLIRFESGKITVQDQEGVGIPSDITTSKVTVDNLTFTKYINSYGFDAVGVNLTMSATAPGGTPVSRILQTTIARVNAATFDSGLIPGTDNAFDVGVGGGPRWKNAAFSGSIGIGADPPILPTRLEVAGGLRLRPNAAPPTCSDANRGVLWVETQGSADHINVCLKNGTNFTWQRLD